MSQLEQRQPETGDENREMTARILSPELKEQFETLQGLLQRALWLAERCADFEATQILRARLTNLQAAALLVIVGEVKAGKSSFINALLREDVCEVAPGPCTVRIQELVYGAERKVETLGAAWQRVSLPKEVLREISMVDTPGTNSIVKDHQTITENYLPQSDLVVFVFSAVNPHTKSAWELLPLIKKEWHRKVVFVLQQADRASQKELTTNLEHVKQYARERQVENPIVFTLSAKCEIEGTTESGFSEFRNYLQSTIAGGEGWRMKVEGSYQTIRSVMTRLLTHLRAEKRAIDDERAFYQDLLGKVLAREAKANTLKGLVIDKLSATYDSLARDAESEFAEALRLPNLVRRALPFRRKKNIEAWLADLKKRFQESVKKEVESEAPRLSRGLVGEMEAMRHELRKGVAQREERTRENVIMPDTVERLNMLYQLRSKLERVPVGAHIDISSNVAEASEVRRVALAGSGLAIVGIILVALSGVLWFDIAGTLFAVAGIFLFASGLLWRRVAILHSFRKKLRDSRDEFRARLESQTSAVCVEVFCGARHALAESLGRLDLRACQIDGPLDETFSIGEAASDMVIVSQRIAVPQQPDHPAVAA